MYCINCGVQLADTEKKCPLCSTVVYHPELSQPTAQELYPKKRLPKAGSGKAVLGGAILILFMIPLVLTFCADLLADGRIDWFGYVAGAVGVAYVTLALPLWFQNPNPVIFVPCDFAAGAGFLLYMNLVTDGNWFLRFAFPLIVGAGVIVCSLVTLLRYLHRGRLYIVGGALIALGSLVLMLEHLLSITFGLRFIGWSFYPLICLILFGGLLIFLAMNSIVREKIERKIFF